MYKQQKRALKNFWRKRSAERFAQKKTSLAAEAATRSSGWGRLHYTVDQGGGLFKRWTVYEA